MGVRGLDPTRFALIATETVALQSHPPLANSLGDQP